jgi:hypothetical protein
MLTKIWIEGIANKRLVQNYSFPNSNSNETKMKNLKEKICPIKQNVLKSWAHLAQHAVSR